MLDSISPRASKINSKNIIVPFPKPAPVSYYGLAAFSDSYVVHKVLFYFTFIGTGINEFKPIDTFLSHFIIDFKFDLCVQSYCK